MIKIVHLVPYDGIGGVESAARTLQNVQQGNIDFHVRYIVEKLSREKNINSLYNPFLFLSSAWSFRGQAVDVLIVSLWRASIVGLLVKLFYPRTKLITFLHSERDVNIFDYLFSRASLWFSSQIWADSEATIRGRVSSSYRLRCRLISFVTRDITPLPLKQVEPVFIFWGRITHEKGIDRAMLIFAEILKKHSGARFLVVGPDGGALSKLQKLRQTTGLAESVIFKGIASFEQIISYAAEASFYMQASMIEGMAMSVVESMQLGLVPIVTPVGEVGAYCHHGKNSVIIDTDEQAVEDVLRVLSSNESYQALRSMAIASWKQQPLYRDSVLNACRSIVEQDFAFSEGIH